MSLDNHESLNDNSYETDQKRKILVISGWWFRWAYALWILKALEWYGIDESIDAIYWVSIWAVIWALRASWLSADDIFKKLKSISIRDFPRIKKSEKLGWVVSSKKIEKMLDELLPQDFESLKIPCYFWVVDNQKWEFILYNKWDLRTIVLGSMSIPVFLPPVPYENKCLIDWWTLNNFPVVEANQRYPNHEIIWIVLNMFKKDQIINSPIKSLRSLIDIVMDSQHQDAEKLSLIKYLFRRPLPIPILSLNKRKMQDTFNLWYEDGTTMFWNEQKK